jgi:hypothetical protein
MKLSRRSLLAGIVPLLLAPRLLSGGSHPNELPVTSIGFCFGHALLKSDSMHPDLKPIELTIPSGKYRLPAGVNPALSDAVGECRFVWSDPDVRLPTNYVRVRRFDQRQVSFLLYDGSAVFHLIGPDPDNPHVVFGEVDPASDYRWIKLAGSSAFTKLPHCASTVL